MQFTSNINFLQIPYEGSGIQRLLIERIFRYVRSFNTPHANYESVPGDVSNGIIYFKPARLANLFTSFKEAANLDVLP